MPPDVLSPGSPRDWLRHARSDLALARIPRTPEILLQALCFHAQQAAEKALKAVLILQGVAPPRTHHIKTLLELLSSRVEIPSPVREAASLTDYAVMSRYPALIEPVTEEEYHEAVKLAEAVISWAESLVKSPC